MKKNVHRGSNFRDFLKADGILEEVEERAMKKALALQLEKLLAKNELTKAEMVVRMKTSRVAVDRVRDELVSSSSRSTADRKSVV